MYMYVHCALMCIAAPCPVQVLVMAGQLKRENPTIQEDLVLIRALRDSNLPKFLSDDAILFKVSARGCFIACTCM